jgi:hypothetical protein
VSLLLSRDGVTPVPFRPVTNGRTYKSLIHSITTAPKVAGWIESAISPSLQEVLKLPVPLLCFFVWHREAMDNEWSASFASIHKVLCLIPDIGYPVSRLQ